MTSLGNYSILRIIGHGLELGFKQHFKLTRLEQNKTELESLLLAFHTEQGLRNVLLVKRKDSGWQSEPDEQGRDGLDLISLAQSKDLNPFRIINDKLHIETIWPEMFNVVSTTSEAKCPYELISKDHKDLLIFYRGPFHYTAAPDPQKMVGVGQSVVGFEKLESGFWIELDYEYNKQKFRQLHIAKQLKNPDGRIFVITAQGLEQSRDYLVKIGFLVIESLKS